MRICVLGSGSWGTRWRRCGDNHHEVVIWGKMPEEIADLKLPRNTKYFPEVLVNPDIEATLSSIRSKPPISCFSRCRPGAVEEVSRLGCGGAGSSGDCDQRRQRDSIRRPTSGSAK